MKQKQFKPIILLNMFDYKVREMCKFCKRYSKSGCCPPYIEDVNYYKSILPYYKNGILFYQKFIINDNNQWNELSKQSSLKIHNQILKVRNQLFNTGHYFINSFGAGSCKFCKKCAIPCIHPESSLIPIEATGINLVQLMQNFQIEINFPITTSFYRIGMILYD